MEEILKQILEGQKQITHRLDNLENGQQELRQEVAGVKSDLFDFKQEVNDIKHEVNAIKQEVTDIKSDMTTKQDMKELHQYLHAVSLEIIDQGRKTDNKIDVLNDRLFQQEADIKGLKKAQ